MAVAKTPRGSLTILGAPRYRHIGAVIAVQKPSTYKKIIPYPKQVRVNTFNMNTVIVLLHHLWVHFLWVHLEW